MGIAVDNIIKESLFLRLGIELNNLVFVNQFGRSNTVYKLKYGGTFYMLKLYSNKELFDKELYAYMLLNQYHCKCPELVGFDNVSSRWILYVFVEGITLTESFKTCSKSKLKTIFENLGHDLHQIHSIEIMNDKHIDYVNLNISRVESVYLEIQKQTYFNKQEIIEKAMFKIRNGFSSYDVPKSCSLIHNDLNGGNIIIKNGKIKAIIDFDQSSIGMIYSDIVGLKYLTTNCQDFEKAFVRGYKLVNLRMYQPLTNLFLLIDSLIYCNYFFSKNSSLFNFHFSILCKHLNGP